MMTIKGTLRPEFRFLFKVHLNPKYFFCSNTSLHLFETHCAFLNYCKRWLFFRLWKLWNLAIICHTTELVRGMGLFLVWFHRVICIALSLCKHACKEVCDVNPGVDPYPLLARSCDRWWPDFITFTACKKSRFGLKRGKKAQCVSDRCKSSKKTIFGLGALQQLH